VSKDLFDLAGPKANSLMGNSGDFGRDSLGFLSLCYREYGDIVPPTLWGYSSSRIFENFLENLLNL